VQSVSVGSLGAGNILTSMGAFSKQFSLSVGALSSGLKPVTAFELSFIENIKSSIKEGVLEVRKMRESIGHLETQKSSALMKVDVMHRIKELATAYNNDTLSDNEKEQIQNQVDELSKLLTSDHYLFGSESKIKIRGASSETGNVISEQIFEDTSFQIFIEENSGGSSGNLSDLFDDNSDFISLHTSGPLQGISSLDPPSAIANRNRFDLSADGTAVEISRALDSYASDAAEIEGRIRTTEYRIKNAMQQKEYMSEQLNQMTAVDYAKETVNMIKSKLGLEMNSALLKIHANIERNSVLGLLTDMR